jgi:hypothetical protein
VRGDVASVAEWWAESARRTDLRAQYETPSETGFSWNESFQDEQLIQVGDWSTTRRLIRARITTTLTPDGCPVQRRTDGSFVREQEFRQARHIPGGREDETVSRRFMEFRRLDRTKRASLPRTRCNERDFRGGSVHRFEPTSFNTAGPTCILGCPDVSRTSKRVPRNPVDRGSIRVPSRAGSCAQVRRTGAPRKPAPYIESRR